MRDRIALATQVQRLKLGCGSYAIETATATALEGAAVPEQMADTDSAPRCVFPQIVRER